MTNVHAPALMALALATCVASCGEGGWFGSSEPPPLPGERIDILDRAAELSADPTLVSEQPSLPPAEDGDWPQAHGGGAHAPGHRTLTERPTLAWTVNIGEGENKEERRIVYAPVVSERAVYTLDAAGAVVALSATDGKRIWSVDPAPKDEEDGFGGGLALGDGRVYYAAGFAAVVAFDAGDGREVWRTTLPTPVHTAPAFADGRVFAITVDNRLFALDAAAGNVIWSYDAPPATAAFLGGAPPAAVGGAVIAATTTGEILAFTAASGRLTWDDSLTAVRRIGVAEAIPAVRAAPVVADGQVIAVGAAGYTAAVDFATGARMWDQEFGGAATPAVLGAYAYLLTDSGRLVALRRQDGRIVWSTDLKAAAGDVKPEDASSEVRHYVGPVAAGGHLIVLRGDGHLLFFRPADGALDHRIRLPGDASLPPVVANRTLYVLMRSGALAAYR